VTATRRLVPASRLAGLAHRLTERQRDALADYLLRVAWGGTPSVTPAP
jgi:hypothetical protein